MNPIKNKVGMMEIMFEKFESFLELVADGAVSAHVVDGLLDLFDGQRVIEGTIITAVVGEALR